MWLFTKIGFFSGTRADFTSRSYADMPRPEDWETVPYIMVRARVQDDLVRLNEFSASVGQGETEIFSLDHHDYPYRTLVPHEAWTILVGYLVADVDYSNFKNAVTDNARTHTEGNARHDLYMKVWSVMHGAERWLQERFKRPRWQSKDQGSLGFWMGSQTVQRDPRDDSDMQALHEPVRGWEDWIEEDEASAMESDLPEGTHFIEEDVTDLVIDNPSPDDITRFEAAMARQPRRRGRGR